MTRLTSHGRRGRLGLRFLHGGAPSTDCLRKQPLLSCFSTMTKKTRFYGSVIGETPRHLPTWHGPNVRAGDDPHLPDSDRRTVPMAAPVPAVTTSTTSSPQQPPPPNPPDGATPAFHLSSCRLPVHCHVGFLSGSPLFARLSDCPYTSKVRALSDGLGGGGKR